MKATLKECKIFDRISFDLNSNICTGLIIDISTYRGTDEVCFSLDPAGFSGPIDFDAKFPFERRTSEACIIHNRNAEPLTKNKLLELMKA